MDMPRKPQNNEQPTPQKKGRGPGHSIPDLERLRVQDAFIAAYVEKGTIKAACDHAGINRSTFYDWQEKDETFSFRFKQAETLYNETLRDEIHRRAIEGWEEPLASAGKLLGTVRKFSDTLLIFHAKMRMPEYREKTQVEVTGKVDVTGAKELLLERLARHEETHDSES